ncbi:MAG: glucose-1-phosphate thymidylyltransferase [Deltaproteobacteria bacterium]|jgi:NDP-sugar pyrophosphorylase family protein|nr:glucose-1-phosphate thymidylyltransferase [Deltaproteobacteria bacterium]
MPWYNASNFFAPPEDGKLRELYSHYDRVYDILDQIGNFVEAVINPNVHALRKFQNGFIPLPVAIVDGKIMTNGVTYDLHSAEGTFKVFLKGEELHDASLILPGTFLADDRIEIAAGVLIESGAMISGPTILGPETAVRQGAYVRGNVLTTSNALIGHATEVKNVIMMDHAKAGHFAYLGDSILGNWVNLGAGTKLANLKMSSLPFRFTVDGETLIVKRRKFGAILGDGVETGCNTVTNPGTLLGQNSRVWPNVTVKAGYHEPLTVIR